VPTSSILCVTAGQWMTAAIRGKVALTPVNSLQHKGLVVCHTSRIWHAGWQNCPRLTLPAAGTQTIWGERLRMCPKASGAMLLWSQGWRPGDTGTCRDSGKNRPGCGCPVARCGNSFDRSLEQMTVAVQSGRSLAPRDNRQTGGPTQRNKSLLLSGDGVAGEPRMTMPERDTCFRRTVLGNRPAKTGLLNLLEK
jgi:hypothetical protein